MSDEKGISTIDGFKKNLSSMSGEIKKLLPPHIGIEKFERVVLSAVQMNSELLNADRKTLFNACLKCASDGLLPDGREAALVIFNSKDGPKVQFMPMYLGIIKRIRNSGDLATVAAYIVHEKDHFEFSVDSDGEHLSHKPILFGERGKPIGCYAVAKTKDNEVFTEFMTVDEIMAVKASSKAKYNSPWDGPFKYEMWKKSAIRRISKRLPMSSDVENFITQDDSIVDLDALPVENKAQKLEALIHQPTVQTEVEKVVESVPVEEGEFAEFKGTKV